MNSARDDVQIEDNRVVRGDMDGSEGIGDRDAYCNCRTTAKVSMM